MKKSIKVFLALLTVLTVVYAIAVAYATIGMKKNDGNRPIDYGINKVFVAERLGTVPSAWNTTDELGIYFGSVLDEQREAHIILIADPQKALPWMRNDTLVPNAVKYEEKYFGVGYLWVTIGIRRQDIYWGFPVGIALGMGWISAGLLLLTDRKNLKIKRE